MRVRMTQIDGKLPNLALMKLAHWHRSQGHEVHFRRHTFRAQGEPEYDRVYGAAIFGFSADKLLRFKETWPGAIVGGTGSGSNVTVEQVIGQPVYEHYDYSDYPGFDASIGRTQNGCRFECSFCVVPRKEGKPRSVNTIADIWRGEGHPKKLHLLDNDFFGQPKPQWKARLGEIRDGGFKVCLNQGINVRVITDEIAAELASVDYYDDSFKRRRLYTAWDSLGDEELFFRGIDRLERAGISPNDVMAYMLIGFDPAETWASILYRANKMRDRGVKPYPMVYGDRTRTLPAGGYNGKVEHLTLRQFQRYVIGGIHAKGDRFEDYKPGLKVPRGRAKNSKGQTSFLAALAPQQDRPPSHQDLTPTGAAL